MANKIELYQELLTIEPNSKVFFPLAQQLAEEDRLGEAVVVLTRGIGQHPDYLEAKFLLLDILTRQGRDREAQAVFSEVGELLARYPSIWLLWSRTAAVKDRDSSLAMLFLGRYFQNTALTWSEVMERGLQSLAQPATAKASTAAPASVSVARDSATPPLRGAKEVMELSDLLEAPESAAGPTRPGKSQETAVRTKTMASLLASQGDVAGALKIYDDLIESTPPGPEREALVALAAALTPAQGDEKGGAAATSPSEASAQAEAPAKDVTKCLTILDALAGRLEALSED